MSLLSSSETPRRDAVAANVGELAAGGTDGCRPASPVDALARRLVLRRLERLPIGRLTVRDADDRRSTGESAADGRGSTVEVHNPRFYRRLLLGGSLGAAESFLRGDWHCDDLVGLVRLFCANAAALSGFEAGPARLLQPLRRLAHWLRRNTFAGSRRNIAAHYDLGDDFFALFLDPTMAYSCAFFPQPDSTLHETSLAKFDRVCRKLDLAAADHVLEIGTGWGGFAVYAAKNIGCRVTTTTISRKQYDYSRQQVEAAGLADRVTVLREDYRTLRGSFDKLVSIEMIEAVGHRYFDAYFRVCSERLRPGGAMLLQAIIIPDQRYERYRRSMDLTSAQFGNR